MNRLPVTARIATAAHPRPVRARAAMLVAGLLVLALPAGAAPPAGEAPAYNKGLLWKIETTAVRPSFLFGTIHSDDARLATLPAPVKARFDQAASFTMEALANATGMLAMAEAMFFNDGNTLEGVLGKDHYRRTVQALAARGLPPESAQKMKPWAAMMTLSLPPPTTGLFLDLALQLEAARQSKPTYGLETMAEQVAVFDELRLEDQVELLRDSVANLHRLDRQIEELIQAYLRRDLAGLAAVERKYRIGDARLNELLTDRLLVARNRVMLERMQPRLREGNAFIAVGALHLHGNDGLLALLEKTGHRVSAVY
ncbi:MAG: TraB/GumN family protein [Gammaproteobacteria bacterium]|nr:TraB/GumN family protein [Gammaproteobacteria bacterium]